MFIAEVQTVDRDLVDQTAELVFQLSPGQPPPTADRLSQIVSSPHTHLYVARLLPEGPIVGMCTLAWYPLPSVIKAWIEDVVVRGDVRGSGIGEQLVRYALDTALHIGASYVDLTSRPEREAANRLYRRIGFHRRETNVYRFRFEQDRTN